MKKNKMMRLASLVLVLVLLTTCCISATFAKYTTTASAADTARVAKFGVAIQTAGTLYSDAYAAGTDTGVPGAWVKSDETGAITVAAATAEDNVVAPGTKSYEHGLSWSVTGTPEVATKYYGEIKTRDIYLGGNKKFAILIPVEDIKDETAYEAYAGRLYQATDNGYSKVKTWAATAQAQENKAQLYVMDNEITVPATGYYPVQYKMVSDAASDGATYTTATTAASSTDPIAQALTAQMAGAAVTAVKDSATTEKTWTVLFENAKLIPTNTDLATEAKLGFEQITWEWVYGELPGNDVTGKASDSDKMDTILAQMMAALNGAEEDYKVVCNEGTQNYYDVTYDATNEVVKNRFGSIIASLRTSIELILTVTQVD